MALNIASEQIPGDDTGSERKEQEDERYYIITRFRIIKSRKNSTHGEKKCI
jgi:hypothetical protein